ncbi:MAG: ATPase, T2SS/T4P/T4SS family [Actinomycetota bacterium]
MRLRRRPVHHADPLDRSDPADPAAKPVDGLDPLRPLLADPEVTEILINGPGPIWIERSGRLAQTDRWIQPAELALLVERVTASVGLRVDRTSPIVDTRLPDGSRVNVVVPPLALAGPTVSIRRFGPAPVSLSAFGPPTLGRLLTDLVAGHASILVVGPTSSGKTTLINALTAAIDPDERIICIEDTAELRPGGRHVVRLEARPPNSEGVGAVPIRRLVLAALRMRPDRLIVGEVRGAEAFDLLLALTSGHRGCLTSCHAEDAASGLRRLETLAALAGVGAGRLAGMIIDGLDAVVTTERVGADRRVRSVDLVKDGVLQRVWQPTVQSASGEVTPLSTVRPLPETRPLAS